MPDEPLIRQQFRCARCNFRPNAPLWGDGGEPVCYYCHCALEPVGPPVVVRAASEEGEAP